MSTREQSRRRTPQDDAWAIAIKTRAGWKCEWCGLTRDQIKALGGELQAAHKKPYEEWPESRTDLDNGLALCTFKDPAHRHPEGKGGGYGCHNSLSGHWGSAHGFATRYTPAEAPSRSSLVAGLLLLGTAGALVYLVSFVPGWGSTWLLEATWAAAGSMAFLSKKHRHGWAVFDLGSLSWMALVGADAVTRYYWHVGVGASPFHVLLLSLGASFAACLVLAHQALTHHLIGRSARAALHGVVRAVGHLHSKKPHP